MIPRLAQAHLRQMLATYPAAALLGPRQAGKTTLARAMGGLYFDLEDSQDRLRLDVQWAEILARPSLVALDEAQVMPELFPRLRVAIDAERQRHGRFLLLGSIAPALMTSVAESLAGRLALCELSPLLAAELGWAKADALWHLGGFPDGGVLEPARFPLWQQHYLDLMAQRDLPQWGLPAKPMVTQRLFRMLAAVHGQAWNASLIGKGLGMSYHTVGSYLDFLAGAYLVRRLPPFAANLRKRLVKSPKVYWRDTGLLHALLGWQPDEDLLDRPWVGASWEGWVIEQILSCLQAAGASAQASFLRTSDGQEIDLVLEYRGRLWAFEVKLTSIPEPRDLERLRKSARLIGADTCVLVSRTTTPIHGASEYSLDLAATLDLLLAA
ncbi:MAG: ATP-binding protein [Thermodesulfobacteriota bacterium]